MSQNSDLEHMESNDLRMARVFTRAHLHAAQGLRLLNKICLERELGRKLSDEEFEPMFQRRLDAFRNRIRTTNRILAERGDESGETPGV